MSRKDDEEPAGRLESHLSSSRSRLSIDSKSKKHGSLLASLVGDTLGSSLHASSDGNLGSSAEVEEVDEETRKALSVEKIVSHFKDRLPNEEWVLGVACSYKRHGIYRQGMMYLTTKRLLFTSPLIRKNVLLNVQQIRGLKKHKTARVIANAILVLTKEKDYLFSSFIKRDKVWKLLYLAWQRECNPSVRPSLDEEDVELEQYAEGSDDTSSGIDAELGSDDDADPFADGDEQPDDAPSTSPAAAASSSPTSTAAATATLLSPSSIEQQQRAGFSRSAPHLIADGLDAQQVSPSRSGKLSVKKSPRWQSSKKPATLPPLAPPLSGGRLPLSEGATPQAPLDLQMLAPANNKAMLLAYVRCLPNQLYSLLCVDSSNSAAHWKRLFKRAPFGRPLSATPWSDCGSSLVQRQLTFEAPAAADASAATPPAASQSHTASLSSSEGLCLTIGHNGQPAFTVVMRCCYQSHGYSKLTFEVSSKKARLEPITEWLASCVRIIIKITGGKANSSSCSVLPEAKRPKLRTIAIRSTSPSTSASSSTAQGAAPVAALQCPAAAVEQVKTSVVQAFASHPIFALLCLVLVLVIFDLLYQIFVLRSLASSVAELGLLTEAAVKASAPQCTSALL